MRNRTRLSGGLLGLALLCSAGLRLGAFRAEPETAEEDASSIQNWMSLTETHLATGRLDLAEESGRAGLLIEPWHPGLCLLLTRVMLKRGDAEALKNWMDELVLGDARLAEQIFRLPEFEPWLNRAEFLALQREALLQARD